VRLQQAWQAARCLGLFERKEWVEAKHWDDDADDWVFQACEFRASHWMPLPSPPGAAMSDALARALIAADALEKVADKIANWTIGKMLADSSEAKEKYPNLAGAILELRAKVAAFRAAVEGKE
jgi:hypothetical protein